MKINGDDWEERPWTLLEVFVVGLAASLAIIVSGYL